LENGADATVHNNAGDTALTEAIRAGQSEVVELLLPKFTAADIKEDSALLYKALLEASAYGKTHIVKFVKSYLAARGYIRSTKKGVSN
jgi:ankyrin repeat protein